MSKTTPVIIVDDSDESKITYKGKWERSGHPDLEYRGSTHFSTADAGGIESTARFSFNGSYIWVYGTVPPNITIPQLSCSLQGRGSESALLDVGYILEPESSPQYHRILCSGPVSLPGETTLVVTSRDSGAPPTFYLDYILYQSLKGGQASKHDKADTPLPVSVIVDDRDLQVTYPGLASWLLEGSPPEYMNTAHGTQVPGSQSNFSFTGTAVEVYGSIQGVGNTTWNATFQVDDGEVVSSTSSSYDYLRDQIGPKIFSNLKLFEKDGLKDRSHNLTITYNGGEQIFWLDYFVYNTSLPRVHSEAPPGPGASSTSAPNPQGPITSISAAASSVSKGTLIGAVMGTAAGILAVCVIILLLYPRFSRQKKQSIALFARDISERNIIRTDGKIMTDIRGTGCCPVKTDRFVRHDYQPSDEYPYSIQPPSTVEVTEAVPQARRQIDTPVHGDEKRALRRILAVMNPSSHARSATSSSAA